ncbi:hypothetical protein GM3708_2289 [Geminocystis sp. NIES-3708]|nr:hypothetical protein GM3708_2289 [Geminocystis sp. NIES-3708]
MFCRPLRSLIPSPDEQDKIISSITLLTATDANFALVELA